MDTSRTERSGENCQTGGLCECKVASVVSDCDPVNCVALQAPLCP